MHSGYSIGRRWASLSLVRSGGFLQGRLLRGHGRLSNPSSHVCRSRTGFSSAHGCPGSFALWLARAGRSDHVSVVWAEVGVLQVRLAGKLQGLLRAAIPGIMLCILACSP